MKRGIASLRHQVLLCSQKDVVTTDGVFMLNRRPAFKSWAAIDAKKGSSWTPNGAATKDTRNTQTHVITMRLRTDVDISFMAWIYEERLQSAARWFKVLTVNETEHKGSPFWSLSCRLVERGEMIADPTKDAPASTGPAQGLPSGVSL